MCSIHQIRWHSFPRWSLQGWSTPGQWSRSRSWCRRCRQHCWIFRVKKGKYRTRTKSWTVTYYGVFKSTWRFETRTLKCKAHALDLRPFYKIFKDPQIFPVLSSPGPNSWVMLRFIFLWPLLLPSAVVKVTNTTKSPKRAEASSLEFPIDAILKLRSFWSENI